MTKTTETEQKLKMKLHIQTGYENCTIGYYY